MKLIISVCGLLLFGILAGAQAQTKIMEFNTGLAWSDSGVFLTAGLTPIGTDFLAVIINRDPTAEYYSADQILYIFDLKKKVLAKRIDVPDQGYYWVSPSATTSSFVLYYSIGTSDQRISLYNFNKKTRNWSLAIDDTFDSGSSTSVSTPVLPGYFVNTVRDGDILELHVFKY